MLRTYRRAQARYAQRLIKKRGFCFIVSPGRPLGGWGVRPKVSQNCFLHAFCHFLSMPEHPYAVEERPGSVGMPSWEGPAPPQECPGRAKERPGGAKIVLRSGSRHPETKNVVKTLPGPENHDFLKIDGLLWKHTGFRRRRRPKIDQKWTPNAPK